MCANRVCMLGTDRSIVWRKKASTITDPFRSDPSIHPACQPAPSAIGRKVLLTLLYSAPPVSPGLACCVAAVGGNSPKLNEHRTRDPPKKSVRARGLQCRSSMAHPHPKPIGLKGTSSNVFTKRRNYVPVGFNNSCTHSTEWSVLCLTIRPRVPECEALCSVRLFNQLVFFPSFLVRH